MPLWTQSVSHRFLLRRRMRRSSPWIARVELLENRCLLAFSVNHTPYLQLGNAALTGYDNGTDQAELIWQTTGVAENDTFTAEFRHNGDLNWNSTFLNIDIVTGLDGRINHSATLTCLAFDSDLAAR
ncbi:MAG: hypothetical protein RJP95_01765 [Pirellulales bacterium]